MIQLGSSPNPPRRITWTHPFIDTFLSELPLDCKSILDVGCGKGFVGFMARIYRNPDRLVGLDTFDEYLTFCSRFNVYHELMKFDLRKGLLPFGDKEFDAVVALEVIEHLDRGEGLQLVQEMERVGSKVIISTPTRFYRQESYDSNPQQIHRSLWSIKDFDSRGYSTILITLLPNYGVRIVSRRGRFVSKLSRFFGNRDQYILAAKTQ